ncbi:glutamine-hydrolyzing carbamoyl-phosphate synthase small subunit [Halocella sp. SP3-1]|uniref:glutamine-hydrolyzing carbamoyl-phosphate synthase small subunit n=1 Tax=Halocella sp. SP3-1 TaxID=2382161 RepID=UPI00197A9067|nr:glutamine-hydrolyzing carbamoyl-phosphate synthase small subunit [Halocella sp. SP3-1]
MIKGRLVLEDGSIFEGEIFGYGEETGGEIVFNTSMTGYQEILTDPSYKGEIVIMTYPLIGNYGINTDDFESAAPHVNGLIVKEVCPEPENWRLDSNLIDYLEQNKVTGICGIDTRALTRKLRSEGTMRGIITKKDDDGTALINKAKAVPALSGRDLVSTVSSKEVYQLGKDNKYRVVLIDCGAKKNIITSLVKRGCQVTVVPVRTTADEILGLNPHGIMLSNGPGDPQDVPYLVDTVKKLLGEKAIFGICLGHQILGLACGAETFKLKFGHRGANHPVKDLASNRVYITSQNHGFAIDNNSVKRLDIDITHLNVNDGTVEGLSHKKYKAFSVQYHPEACPGPEDSNYLFDKFIAMF